MMMIIHKAWHERVWLFVGSGAVTVTDSGLECFLLFVRVLGNWRRQEAYKVYVENQTS
jgi:hypothetical protein